LGCYRWFSQFYGIWRFPNGWLRKQRYEYIQVSAGVILNKDLSKVHSVDLEDLKTVEEYVNNSWYDYEGILKVVNNLGVEKQKSIIQA
jgi:hydrogenase large subunit